MINIDETRRFLAMSWLYLLMNEKTSDERSIVEIEDLISALNDERVDDQSGSCLV